MDAVDVLCEQQIGNKTIIIVTSTLNNNKALALRATDRHTEF